MLMRSCVRTGLPNDWFEPYQRSIAVALGAASVVKVRSVELPALPLGSVAVTR